MTPVETIRQNLGNSMLHSDTTHGRFSKDAHLTQQTISNFLSGKKVSQRTLSKIENAMIQKGWMQDPMFTGQPLTPIKRVSKALYAKTITTRVLACNLSAEDKVEILSKLL